MRGEEEEEIEGGGEEEENLHRSSNGNQFKILNFPIIIQNLNKKQTQFENLKGFV